MGVQDDDPKVQKAVHRIQPLEMTQQAWSGCARLDFTRST